MMIAAVAGIVVVALISFLSCCLMRGRKESSSRSIELPAKCKFGNLSVRAFPVETKSSTNCTEAKKLGENMEEGLTRPRVNRTRKISPECSIVKRCREAEARRTKLQKCCDIRHSKVKKQGYEPVCQILTAAGSLESYRSHLGHRNLYPGRSDRYDRQPPAVPMPDFDR
ncbi:uncharacterized protein LOC124181276 [Neodiprion fabricii]|uniref:uncharacterized protein LOC124181276 n=1 Tax=Neodiprion fabricii TaxID=2872261 RepID=UPI001ED9548C|nr:uncharacterized protein LOC124181276 [Neodiprion fabricii]